MHSGTELMRTQRASSGPTHKRTEGRAPVWVSEFDHGAQAPAPLVVRRRYLIVVPRPMPAASCMYYIVLYRPLPSGVVSTG
jgi:hypothetical protein